MGEFIDYGCNLCEESKKQNRGCCELLGDDCGKCCKVIGFLFSQESSNAFNMGECFVFEQDDFHKKIWENREDNIEILKQIYAENEKLKVKMKEKLDKLINEREQKSPIVIIGTGNSCNSDCYLYNLDLWKTCPKCEGKVEEEFENDYTIEHKWNDSRNAYEELKIYNEKKICTGFRWNNNISKCDVDLKEMFNYFDKKDPEKKTHYSIVTKEKKTEEFDVEGHYMMLDGERFDFPSGLTMHLFLFINNEYFFPRKTIDIDYSLRTPFWYEGQHDRPEIGQSFGFYGYAWKHIVFIYTCNSCGYKYHIIKTSPFAVRDKSKDPE